MSAPRGTGKTASRPVQRTKVKSAAEVYAPAWQWAKCFHWRIRADFRIGQPKSQETQAHPRVALAAKPSEPPLWRRSQNVRLRQAHQASDGPHALSKAMWNWFD